MVIYDFEDQSGNIQPTKVELEVERLKKALDEILQFKKNPIRRCQYAGAVGYEAPDWIQTKDAIFDLVEKALKEES